MNRYSLIFATALILLFSRSAHSQQEAQQLLVWWNAGFAAKKENLCSTASIENFEQFVANIPIPDVSKNKIRLDYAKGYITGCDNLLNKRKFASNPATIFKGSGFELHREDLNKLRPPSLSNGKDHIIVKKITDKLGVPAINVYDIPDLRDAFVVKPVPGAKPVFKADPQFEGIVVDPRYMYNDVDVTEEEIADMKRQGKDVPRFIEHGRQRRYGVLAHEVAHMLLPVDLHGFYANNVQKKDIQVQNARVKRVLENLHDAISEGKFNRSYGMAWGYVNEMAADYVAGGILAYMEVGEEGLEYMLKMYDAAGGSGDVTHLRAKERIKIFKKGYEARSVE